MRHHTTSVAQRALDAAEREAEEIYQEQCRRYWNGGQFPDFIGSVVDLYERNLREFAS